jgi:hypothetical protein
MDLADDFLHAEGDPDGGGHLREGGLEVVEVLARALQALAELRRVGCYADFKAIRVSPSVFSPP